MPDSSPFLKALQKKKQPLPSASIGQYAPQAPAPFSPQSAAASNPMLAPQFDTSYSPSSGGSSGGTSYQKKTPYDAGSAFNTGGSSFDSFGSAPTRRGYTNPMGQTEYADTASYSDKSGTFQQATNFQDPFQVSPSPYQFRSETSNSTVRPTEVTEITTAAPSRDAYTGASAQVPSLTDPDGPVSIFNSSDASVTTPSVNRAETLNENVAAIESVAQPVAETPGILDTITGNLAESRLGKFLGGMTTYDVSQGGDVASGPGTPVFPSLAERTESPAFGSSDIPAAPAAPVAQNPTVNFPEGDLGPQNQFAAQGNAGTQGLFAAPELTSDTQPTLAADPNSAFNVESMAATEGGFGKAPQLTDKYGKKYDAPDPITGYKSAADAVGKPFLQLQTPEDPIIAGLKGIIEKDGIDYGVVEGREHEFVQVSPERKAAFEKRGREFNELNKIDGIGASTDADGFRRSTWETSRNNPDTWNATQKKNFAETGDTNMSGAGARAWKAGAPARARAEEARVKKNRVADRKKADKSEMEQRIRDNNRTPQSMGERRAFEQALRAEYRQKEQFARAEDVERAGIAAKSRQEQARLALGEKELAANVDYRNKSLAQGDRQIDATLAEGQRVLAAEQTEKFDTIVKEGNRMDSQLSFLTDSAMKMSGMQDWSTEGFVGWAAEKLPFQTKAAQVNRLATSFQGNAFLRSIIDSKSLGATFGALSDTEGTKITAADAILMDTKMGNVERMDAAKQIIDTIKSARANAMGRLERAGGGGRSQAAPRQSGNVPQVEGVTITSIG